MNHTIVRQAILDRRSLSGAYAGTLIHFSPHVMGRGPDRTMRIVAFQYAGGGMARARHGGRWRCLRLARLVRLRPNADGWASGHGRYRPRFCVVRVDVSSW